LHKCQFFSYIFSKKWNVRNILNHSFIGKRNDLYLMLAIWLLCSSTEKINKL
jgi:hypothetical protein